MTTLKEYAQAYEPPQRTQFKNIAELPKVDLSVDLKEDIFIDKEGIEKKYLYFEVEEYRVKVPVTVLDQVKEFQKEIVDLKAFRVKKTGEGVGTKYYVVPLPN